jgi:hypothetical protein
MRRLFAALFSFMLVIAIAGCANVVPSGVNILVGVTTFPNNIVQVGGAPITLTMAYTRG